MNCVALMQIKFATVKYHGHAYKFYLNRFFLFDETSIYSNGAKF
jgi:hypothetical protein